jgi:DNA processing protein
MGKKIFAVPGPITSSVSAGTNLLIKTNMAKMFTNVSDILETDMIVEQKKLFATTDEIERKIIEVLMIEELTLDEICHKTGINVSELCVKLSMLSMKNITDERNGKYYLI